MKKKSLFRGVLIATLVTISLFSAVLISSCKKESETIDKCKGVYCLNGGSCSDGVCKCPTGYTGVHCEIDNTKSYIELKNKAATIVAIDLNGDQRTILPEGTTTYTGTPGSNAHFIGLTYGAASNGSKIGIQVNWDFTIVFPPGGQTKNEPLDVSGTLFFLKIKNNSSKPIQGMYVNYGLPSQTFDDIIIPNDGQAYSTGYYSAYTNTNVRANAQSGGSYWFWDPLVLTFYNNQVATITAN